MPRRRHPWPERYVAGRTPGAGIASQFRTHLADAKDEGPLQAFLARHPILLRGLLPAARDIWCFDRPRFGAEVVPDFLLCARNSSGFNWALVELESPTAPVLTKAGRMAAKLNDALRQVGDWRAWLRQNVAYAERQLGLLEIHAEIPAFVVIGRRARIAPGLLARYRELSISQRVTVLSYDRLLDGVGRPKTGGLE